MTDRKTASTINDAELDALYRERDEARQHAATIAAQRDRLRQRMNNLADRWDTALAVDKPYARTLRNEISVAPFDPDGAMTVREYTERGQHLWAFRCWGTDTCDGWLGLGHHTQTSALLERERHVAEAHKEPDPVSPELSERIRALIESEVYEYRERTMFWPETGGVTQEIARLAARGALEALTRALNNPDAHVYLSTGCLHDDHDYCQSMTGLNGAKRPGECKKCGAKCICPCHQAEPREHCGQLSPETLLTTPRTECALRPGHSGSHADEVGCRWWPIGEEKPGA